MPQPDAFLFIEPEYGGRARVGEDGYLVGAPELAAEVSASSASYDLREKFEVFRRNGVREYVVWRTKDRAIDWFVLREGRLRPPRSGGRRPVPQRGVPRPLAGPGGPDRWRPGALGEAIRRGVATPEHAAFVEKLRLAANPAAP